MEAIILIILIVVGFIVVVHGAKRLGDKVYYETGYNAFTRLNKFLSMCIFLIPLIIVVLSLDTDFDFLNELPSPLIGAVVPIAILAVLNLKAKNPAFVVGLTVFQALFGLTCIFIGLFKFIFSVILRSNNSDFFSIEIGSSEQTFDEYTEQFETNEGMQPANESVKAHEVNSGFGSIDNVES